VELDIDTVYDDGPGNVGTFQQFMVAGTAPAGTTIVRVRASMVDGLLQVTNPQTAFVDDFELAGPVAALFDVDGDGMSLPLTDGLLIVRYLFGFTGAALTNGAVGEGCTRCSAAQIEAYLEGPVG
jgi:hypothetical protein